MKKQFLIAFAVVVAFAASAFTLQGRNSSHEKATDYAYFMFTGDDVDEEDEPLNWTRISSPSASCSGTSLLCVIKAPLAGDDQHPDFTGISDVRSSNQVTIFAYRN
jgi:hypothetical protein